jgi:hypothetical protein
MKKTIRLQDTDFKQLIGVKEETYNAIMIAQLQLAYGLKA